MTHNAGLREGLVHKMVYILRLAAELRQRDKAADIAVEPYELLGDCVGQLLIIFALDIQAEGLSQSRHSVELGACNIGENIGQDYRVGQAVAYMVNAADGKCQAVVRGAAAGRLGDGCGEGSLRSGHKSRQL